MPTRRRQQSEGADAADVSISHQGLESLLTSMQRSQAQLCEEMFERILTHTARISSPSSTDATTPTVPDRHRNGGNFAKCTARFSGASTESLDGFIDSVISYKDCAEVNDENALRGLSMLLTNDAAVWWQGIKATVSSWDEALSYLRSAFGELKPPHRIYQEIFDSKQMESENTDLFVSKIRALFAKLPSGELSEKIQLDMLYGLLHRKVRERLPRNNIQTFTDLLIKARDIEDSIYEITSSNNNKSNKSVAPHVSTTHSQTRPATTTARAFPANSAAPRANNAGPSRAAAASRSSAPIPTPASQLSKSHHSITAAGGTHQSLQSTQHDDETSRRRSYCIYCRKPGHTKDECERLQSKLTKTQPTSATPMSCYGCGAAGVLRRQCTNCNPATQNATFYSLETQKQSTTGHRPLSQSRSSKIATSCIPADNNTYLDTASLRRDDSYEDEWPGAVPVTYQVSRASSERREPTARGSFSSQFSPVKQSVINNSDKVRSQCLMYNREDCNNNITENICTRFKNVNKCIVTKSPNISDTCYDIPDVNFKSSDKSGERFSRHSVGETALSIPPDTREAIRTFTGSRNLSDNSPVKRDKFCSLNNYSPGHDVISGSLKDYSAGDDITSRSSKYSPGDGITSRSSKYSPGDDIISRTLNDYSPDDDVISCTLNDHSPSVDAISCSLNDYSTGSIGPSYAENLNYSPGVDTKYGDSFCRPGGDNKILPVYVNDLIGRESQFDFRKLTLRPLLTIKLLGVYGTALIDTAAKGCIAGHTLYKIFKQQGYPMQETFQRIKLADGSVSTRRLLTTDVDVMLQEKCISVHFMILPDAQNNETLLGIDFLKTANIVVDLGNHLWYFSDSDAKYELQYEKGTSIASCNVTEVLRADEGLLLGDMERNALADLIAENEDLFRPGGGPTPFAQHCINTGTHPPISVPPYRLTPAKKEIMRVEIEKMLAEDVIEECESAWSSPALLVPKSNGSIRFCVDYRRLNSITEPDAYPMPLIDELLQSTRRSNFMSTIDLRAGYWQVAVREEDRDKTAFTCPYGTYRFKRMPFGLRGAPASFQRLIDKLRSSSALKDIVVLAYLDDILVISESFQQHLEDLRAVFDRLRYFNLRINREKCVFAREKVKYLGHIISRDGVSPDDTKIEAILHMEPPNNLRHLRTFLQTCSWFRKFIPNFSAVAEPLTRLTRKNQLWQWLGEQQVAFLELKRLLTSAPILIQADYTKPFVLRTDASQYALGAVLLQGQGNDERPIEYASRLLTPAERNYSTTEREALAVVWSVEKFRGYIDGHPVVVASDHQPLKWLLTLKSPSGRLVRWALKLQAFDLKFEYTPGKVNVVADTLSRPVCSDSTRDSCGICSVIIDLPQRNPTELRQLQLSDDEVKKIVVNLEGDEELSARQWSERGYILNQGVLYRYSPESDTEEPQLIVPKELQQEILKECHDSPLAGHPGIERTYQRVAQHYYFSGMRRIVTDYVRSCIDCQRYKPRNEKPSGLLQTPLLHQRNEVLAVDLFGPLPEGEMGERWILLVEDTATRWVELYPLVDATAENCAQTLVEEYFLRYGFPRRIVSDNGVQFVSAVMQQCMFVLDVKQSLTPLYHPQANPAERKNRDLKTLLSILVGENHFSWPKQLPLIRFAMNSSFSRTTGVTPSYLTFARELRSPMQAKNDLRGIIDKENFVPQITPYLKEFVTSYDLLRDRVEKHQDEYKQQGDQHRKPSPVFDEGDLVLLKTHVLSKASHAFTSKLAPRRDGPYEIKSKLSPTTYLLTAVGHPEKILGKYHVQHLTKFTARPGEQVEPVLPKKVRGRPKVQQIDEPEPAEALVPQRGRNQSALEGESIANRLSRRTARPSRYYD